MKFENHKKIPCFELIDTTNIEFKNLIGRYFFLPKRDEHIYLLEVEPDSNSDDYQCKCITSRVINIDKIGDLRVIHTRNSIYEFKFLQNIMC